MSFKVGDRVRCVDPGQWTKLVKGLVYKVTDVAKSSEFGGSVCVDGIEDGWWYSDRFELVPQPVAVHTGGPYVARSEYERVLAESAAKDKAIAELAEHIRQLDRMIHGPTPNGWPLVPVDPSCIPEGHRAVEVTKDVMGKLVAVQNKTVRMSSSIYANLIVEPIPTPAQDARVSCNEEGWVFLYKGALPAGWWYGFDSEGRWWGCSVRPRPTKYGWWEVPPGQTGDWQKLEGMPEADKSAWRENCWQVV